MRVAVIGATGLVGQKMLSVMEERNFPVSQLIPIASERSKGKQVTFKGKPYEVCTYEEGLRQAPQIAFFSAGGSASLKLAPLFETTGCYVVDNSSAWRMNPDKKLVVPEVNADVLSISDKIIANPNCSTIQLAVVLQPLYVSYGIFRIVVSTYQSVTGSGIKAVRQLEGERRGVDVEKVYPYNIDRNAIPHIDVFESNGYTKEEMKIIKETKKIMRDDKIGVTATAVRIPVIGGHGESVNVVLGRDASVEEIQQLLASSPGICLQDNVDELVYPMPISAHDKDDVFVGRIRRDASQPNTFNLWIVSDNLRKGAATNAIQIGEYIISKGWVKA